MYKLTKNNYIVRIDDNTHIPNDIKNIDYLAYLEWLNAGNTPLPVDPKTQEELILEEKVSKIKEEKNKLTADLLVKYLIEHTNEEIDVYIRNNIKTLDDIKNIIIKIATVIGITLRE